MRPGTGGRRYENGVQNQRTDFEAQIAYFSLKKFGSPGYAPAGT
jgi:hypothetical protein